MVEQRGKWENFNCTKGKKYHIEKKGGGKYISYFGEIYTPDCPLIITIPV